MACGFDGHAPAAIRVANSDHALDETEVDAVHLVSKTQECRGLEPDVVHRRRVFVDDRGDSAAHVFEKPGRHGKRAAVLLDPDPRQ